MTYGNRFLIALVCVASTVLGNPSVFASKPPRPHYKVSTTGEPLAVADKLMYLPEMFIPESQIPEGPAPGVEQVDHFFDVFTVISLQTGEEPPLVVSTLAQMDILSRGVVDPPSGITAFELEVLQWNIEGGGLPPGVMIRESPTLASLGETTYTEISSVSGAASGGGSSGGPTHQVDSFFDVFLELSLDGGQTWYAASGPMRMVAVPEPSAIGLLLFCGLALLRRRPLPR